MPRCGYQGYAAVAVVAAATSAGTILILLRHGRLGAAWLRRTLIRIENEEDTLQFALAKLRSADARLACQGLLLARGLAAASRAVNAELYRARNLAMSKQEWPSLKQDFGDDKRIQAGGRTHKTGLEHLALLQELRPYEVLLLGDSDVQRFAKKGHGADHLAILEQSVGRIFPAGVGGDCIRHLAFRVLQQRLLDEFRSPLRAVVVFIGSNDLMRGFPEFDGSAEAAAEAVADLTRFVAAHPAVVGGQPVVVVAAQPIREVTEKFAANRRRFNAHLGAAAKEIGARFVDGLIPEGQPELFFHDGIHFSSEGYRVFANGLLPLLS